MSTPTIKLSIFDEITQALQGLKERIVSTDNADEICAKINADLPTGDLWSFINCYPAVDENLILILAVIEAERCILEVKLEILTG